MAVREDHTFDLGEHWIIQITCHKDPAGAQILDISGAGDVALGVAGLVFNKASGNTVIPVGTDGVATITVPPASQSALPLGAHFYTIRATGADGSIVDQALGMITIQGTPFAAP